MKKQLEMTINNTGTPVVNSPRTQPSVDEPSESELATLFKELHVTEKKPVLLALVPGYSKYFRPEALDKKYPTPLSGLYDETFATTPSEPLLRHCESIFENITMTEEEATNCEADTRAQSKSKKWFTFRTGRITASKMKSVCRSAPDKPSLSLVKDICYPSKSFSTAATKWGCDHEKKARQHYIDSMQNLHENFQLKESGLIITPKYPFLGATPDGIGSCDCCGDVILEVKCPYCRKDSEIDENVDCLEMRGEHLHLKTSHAYYYQVQCQLLLSKAKYCDFVVWTNTDFFSERITFNGEFCEDMVGRASEFFRKAVLPELVGKLFSRSVLSPLINSSVQPISNPDMARSYEVICICRKPYRGERVIGCDDENCPYTWLHLKCIGIRKVPSGKWLCKDCREECKPQKKRKC
ncbi:unnamed protein product [Knipowitschia caucasica]